MELLGQRDNTFVNFIGSCYLNGFLLYISISNAGQYLLSSIFDSWECYQNFSFVNLIYDKWYFCVVLISIFLIVFKAELFICLRINCIYFTSLAYCSIAFLVFFFLLLHALFIIQNLIVCCYLQCSNLPSFLFFFWFFFWYFFLCRLLTFIHQI